MNWVSFESGGRRLRGILHPPLDAPQGAFVFCAPFAEEEKCSHRVLRDAAGALAQAGYAVLRFHYRGCGDSEGEFEEFTLDDWRQDIHAALDFVRSHVINGASSLNLLGLRLGASLAAQVAEERDDIHRLILWEPIVNGRSYVAQNLLRKHLRAALTNHPTTRLHRLRRLPHHRPPAFRPERPGLARRAAALRRARPPRPDRRERANVALRSTAKRLRSLRRRARCDAADLESAGQRARRCSHRSDEEMVTG